MILQRFGLSFEYPVDFTEGIFEVSNPVLARILRLREPSRRHRVLLVLDSNLELAWPKLTQSIAEYADAHAPSMELVGEPVRLPGGESAKNDPAVLDHLYQRLHALGIDRHSFVLVVGGGAVLDVSGYAAATTHRGVRCVRVPTTVLAQADGGIGVKNGINAFGKKNFLGTFAPPFAVLCDPRFVTTLPAREARAGYAEAVKVALLKDPGFFEAIRSDTGALYAREPSAVARLIRRSAELHLEHIARGGDPFEFGSARPLDFGHWAAHKLETLTAHRLQHGEAVAIGMAVDTVYSHLTGLCDLETVHTVLGVLERLGLATWDEALELPELLEGLRDFREHLGGELCITLLRGVGTSVQVSSMDETRVAEAIQSLHKPRTSR